MGQVFATPLFSKGQVNKAGSLLRLTDPDVVLFPVGWDDSLTVINNWRACHSFPLQVVKMTLRKRAHKIARASRSKALVAQRLKRLESIWTKLRANEHMSLTQMQDIGGCRAVMRSMTEVNHLVKTYEKSILSDSAKGPLFCERYNYVAEPKDTGYRSVHYVYKYRTARDSNKCFDGLRIEIQLRSQLQHAWATAVETVSMLTRQALKSNIGTDEWKRFFALMGTAIAFRERTPIVPNTPTNRRELFDELQHFAEKLKVKDVLSGYGVAVYELTGQEKGAVAFLVVLDPVLKEVAVTPFPKAEMLVAEQRYLEAEKALDREKGMQAVLVSAESVSSLRRAYPNYFLDTSAFLDALAKAVAK
jgi:ppGpp synthetase/RelA/SpoT-type nucleotidyltranferase